MGNKSKSERSPDVEYCVYAHVLRCDGRMYIGKAKYRMQSNGLNRWGDHGCRYEPKPNPRTGVTPISHFWNAICEYGWAAFDHFIIKRGLTAKEAEELEAELIENLDTIEHGFNLTKGKDGGTRKGHGMSDDTKRKIGEANHRRASDPESHKRRSEAAKKRNQEEDPEKKAARNAKGAETKRQKHLLPANAKTVRCIELNREWPSTAAAAKEFGLDPSAIQISIKSKGKWRAGTTIIDNTVVKLHWEYKENK